MDDGREWTLTLTLVSPAGRHQVAVPARELLGGFLPELVAWVGLDTKPATAGWVLATPSHVAIEPGQSLADAGVGTGEVVYLSREHSVRPAAPAVSPPGVTASRLGAAEGSRQDGTPAPSVIPPGGSAAAPIPVPTGAAPSVVPPGGAGGAGRSPARTGRQPVPALRPEAVPSGTPVVDGPAGRSAGPSAEPEDPPSVVPPTGPSGVPSTGRRAARSGTLPTVAAGSDEVAPVRVAPAEPPAGPAAGPPARVAADAPMVPPAGAADAAVVPRAGPSDGWAEPRLAGSPESAAEAVGAAETAVPGLGGSDLVPTVPRTPIERTAAALPARIGFTRRLAAATRVFFVAHDAGPRPPWPATTPTRVGSDAGPGPGTSVPAGSSSAELAVARGTPRLARVRREWRSLDYQTRLDQAITRPRLRRCATVAIVSPKGGVGKTTLTALLGTLLAHLRRDHVVAVDANPDFGSLGRVLTPTQPWFVDDILQLIDQPDLSLSTLDAHLGRAIHGLLVVPAPTDPARMQRLDQDAYGHVIRRLKAFSGLVLLDCGTGLHEPAARAAIDACDQVLLVTDGEPSTASLVAEAAQLLRVADRPVTVVVNKMPNRLPQLDIRRLQAAIPEARGLVVVPAEPAAASALAMGRFDWADAPPAWKIALRELAVVLLADHARLGISLPPSWPGSPL